MARTLRKNKRQNITRDTIRLFVRTMELRERSEEWEEDGGCRRAYLDSSAQLQAAVGLKLWDQAIDDCVTDEPPVYIAKVAEHLASWQKGRAIFLRLSEAAERTG